MRSRIIAGAVAGVLLVAGAGGGGYAIAAGRSDHGSDGSRGAMHSAGMDDMHDPAMHGAGMGGMHDPAMHAAHHPMATKGR